MFTQEKTTFRLSAVSLALMGLLSSGAHAQDNNASEQAVEKIIVTATKRAQSIDEIPFSINAQTQRDFERSGAGNLEDVARNVASVAIQNLGPGQSQVSMRGVSAGQIVRDQPGVKEQVGVYLDESVISLSLFTPDLDLFDLSRIETLRGPQGTLFGSGSIGGTLRYITNQPELDTFEGKLEANLNSVTDGGMGGHVKGMVNVPISDTIAMRAVVYRTDYAGFIDAYGPEGSVKQDVNDGDRTGGRVAFIIAPNDKLTITPRVIFQELETNGFNRQEAFNIFANPYTTTWPARQLGEREQYLLLEEGFSDDTFIADVTAEYRADIADFTFVYSYTDRDILVSRDASALSGSVSIDLGFPEEAVTLPSNLLDRTEVEQDTFELRAASKDDGNFDWLVGAFYSSTERTYDQSLPTPGYDAYTDATLGEGTAAAVANGFDADSPYNAYLPYDLKQLAVFGEINYQFTDDFKMTMGSRFYDYEEERQFISGGLFANADNQTDATESDGFTSRVIGQYTLTENVNINAQVSQGFRLGGVNDPLNRSLCSAQDEAIFGSFQDYDDEKLTNYELGMKSSGRGWSANVSAFYNDIEDLQVTLDAGSCSSRVSFNVPEAHTQGIEFELTRQFTEQLFLSLTGSIIEAEFDSTVVDGSGAVLGGVAKGNRLASVPEESFAIAFTYDLASPLLSSNSSYFQGSYQYVGDRITQPSDQVDGAGVFVSGLAFGGATGTETTELDLLLDAYGTLNMSFGLSYDDYEILVYANNLFDENALLSFDRERGGRARLGFTVNQPRTIGATFRYYFQ
ncbi:TonB-dependent receptor [Aestuariibacter sp. A3R04]|uniref:TonB-dependent receptor n=1 Tax=Aestuariibacter sp. A3R04 TaxID=2841571 RepID=UPI001C09789F|nr:TonB-dependent receptor [Aestuariibacter sp. A3R04]MBU3023261.1 TonB-dependent receptor [Aestuariibacter sp. A3R04]